MLNWLKRFFTDETAFVGVTRAAIMGAGAVVATGNVDLGLPESVGVGVMALSSMIRAGDKNPAK